MECDGTRRKAGGPPAHPEPTFRSNTHQRNTFIHVQRTSVRGLTNNNKIRNEKESRDNEHAILEEGVLIKVAAVIEQGRTPHEVDFLSNLVQRYESCEGKRCTYCGDVAK